MDCALTKRPSCPPRAVAKALPISSYKQQRDGGSSCCGRGSVRNIGPQEISCMSFCPWNNADDHRKRRIEIRSSYSNRVDGRSSGLEIVASSSTSSSSSSSSFSSSTSCNSMMGRSSVVNGGRGRQILKKKKRNLLCSVVSMVAISRTDTSSSSPESRPEAPSEDDLKDQLDALQQEALHVRDRYNNARARFMRLTEVAQQLRRRAKLDIDAGDEGSARSLLDEKRKVIRAAELSKKRAELLEELSVKLDEAISKKETQLIIVLSSLQSSSNTAPTTVRVVLPKDEELFLSEDDVVVSRRKETTVAGQEAAEDIMPSDEEITTRAESFLGGTTQENGGQDARLNKQVSADNSGRDADAMPEDKGNESGADIVYSTFRDLYGKEAELEATLSELFSDSESLPSEIADEAVGTTEDPVLQSPAGKLLASDQSQAALTSHLDAVGPKDDALSTSSELLSSGSDMNDSTDIVNGSRSSSSPENGDGNTPGPDGVSHGMIDPLLGKRESTGAAAAGGREVSFYDGESLLFADYLRDVDHQVAAAESKLRIFMVTAVSSNQDTVDKKLRLVGELLEQVQSVRARLSEVVTQFRDTRLN